MRKNWYIEYTIDGKFHSWFCDKRVVDGIKQFSNTTNGKYKILLLKKYNSKTKIFEVVD